MTTAKHVVLTPENGENGPTESVDNEQVRKARDEDVAPKHADDARVDPNDEHENHDEPRYEDDDIR